MQDVILKIAKALPFMYKMAKRLDNKVSPIATPTVTNRSPENSVEHSGPKTK